MKTKLKIYKNILGSALCVAVLGAMTACDPLGVEPTTKVEESNFWGNSQLARAYVDNFYFIGETASGNTFQSEQWSDNCQGNLQTDWADYRQFTFTRRHYDQLTGSVFSAPWSGSYKNIRSIYVAIENITAANLTDELKNQLLAESHFFLAYVYFDLIKYWGTVPYVEKALTLEDNTFIPQSTREYVFDQILANLDKSIEYFGGASSNGELGRVNKHVANAYKSRVALYAANAAEASSKNLHNGDLFRFEKNANHYYQQAYNAASAVTGYSLEANYEDLFTSPDAYKSPESIWPVMFQKDKRGGFNPTAKNGPNGYYYGATTDKNYKWECRGGTFPTQDLVDCYLQKDEKTGEWKKWWETSQAKEMGVVVSDGSVVTKTGVTIPAGELYGENVDYRKIFENRDARFYATVTYDGSYLCPQGKEEEMYLIQTWLDDTDPANTLKYSALHAAMRIQDNLKSAPEGYGSELTITGYYQRKYSQFAYNEDGTLNKDQRQTCYFNIRYAEVLLNKAEAAIKLNKEGEALGYINQIRNRAGVSSFSGSGEALWEEYKTQRRLEFAYECPGHRYFDLLRWNEAEGNAVIDELNTASRGLWISRKGVESLDIDKNGYPVAEGEEGYKTPEFWTFDISALNENYLRKFDNARYYFMPFTANTLAGYTELQQNPGWTNYTYEN